MNHIYVMYHNPHPLLTHHQPLSRSPTISAPVRSDVLIASHSNLQPLFFRFSIYYSILGFAVLVVAYLQMSLWTLTAARQAKRIRELFFHSIMQQDISWYDVTETGELNTRLTEWVTHIIHTPVPVTAGVVVIIWCVRFPGAQRCLQDPGGHR